MRAGRGRLGEALVVAIPALWLAAFVLAPFAIVLKISLSTSAAAQPPYRPLMPWSLDAGAWASFVRALGVDNYRTLIVDSLYREAIASSLLMAALATAIIAPFGYAIALAISRSTPGWRPVLAALVVLPFWTSFLVRVYAWIGILKDDGWLGQALVAAGLAARPPTILDTDVAVLIGLVYTYLPFMILPIYASLDRQDGALVEAAADLGATPIRRFWTITFPLSASGFASGCLLCFIPMVGEYVVPELLGGPDTLMLGRTLWIEFSANRDWPLASAVAMVLLGLLLWPIVALREIEQRRLAALR